MIKYHILVINHTSHLNHYKSTCLSQVSHMLFCNPNIQTYMHIHVQCTRMYDVVTCALSPQRLYATHPITATHVSHPGGTAEIWIAGYPYILPFARHLLVVLSETSTIVRLG